MHIVGEITAPRLLSAVRCGEEDPSFLGMTIKAGIHGGFPYKPG
jgi:hypothetical protein